MLRRFKLLNSVHVEPKYDENGSIVYSKDQRGELTVIETITHKASDPDSCIVTSAKDLTAMFGREKFEPLDANYVDLSIKPKKLTDTVLPGDLERMNVEQLKDYAADNEIDLMGAITKKDIINNIKATMLQATA